MKLDHNYDFLLWQLLLCTLEWICASGRNHLYLHDAEFSRTNFHSFLVSNEVTQFPVTTFELLYVAMLLIM
jgi:hypothetical protein